MKKSFREKFTDLILYLLLNIPLFVFIWLTCENSLKLSKANSILIAAIVYIYDTLNQIKHDYLEERIKKLEENTKL